MDKSNPPPQPKFPLGMVLATAGAVLALDRANQLSLLFLKRHSAGDWGEVCDGDKKLNDEAVIDGGRLLSAYTTRRGEKVWIITEADRSATTVLLPEEY